MSTLIRDFELKLKLLCLYILSLYGIRISLKPALKLFVAVFRRGAAVCGTNLLAAHVSAKVFRLVTNKAVQCIRGRKLPAKMAALHEGVEHLLAIISSFSKTHIPPLCTVITKR